MKRPPRRRGRSRPAPKTSASAPAAPAPARVTVYRFVRLVNDNFEMSARSDADCIGEYEIHGDGLPMHVRDWPVSYAFTFGPAIERLPEYDDEKLFWLSGLCEEVRKIVYQQLRLRKRMQNL